jgi:hypothetical protein
MYLEKSWQNFSMQVTTAAGIAQSVQWLGNGLDDWGLIPDISVIQEIPKRP